MTGGSSGYPPPTRHGLGAFTEALRQQVTGRHVRVSVVEPGATDTELSGHNRPEVLAGMRRQVTVMQPMAPEDVADAVGWIVTRPRQVAVNEILIRSTEQVY